ncbi:MAG: class I SAM-dependent methyltransferase [Gammaproteobacteria bacterium]|nr:class I SAM-dependent methyltransferase [Gammaproteobacteria bacterium]MBU2478685.1 class I SAM-dependent methyltransferase [Gammaproteobacteria bacterium]
MQNERKAHWEQVYRDKSPLEVSWYQTAPTLSLELILASGIDRDSPLIDVGGGASTLVDNLLACGFTAISVLDISAQALAHARQRLGLQSQQVHWIDADITRFEPTERYALWHDRAVFHFLTEADDRLRYRQALARALKPDGQVIIGTFAPGGPLRCSGLPIVQYDAASLQAEFGAAFELVETRSETHRTPSGKDQLFNFFRLLRRL